MKIQFENFYQLPIRKVTGLSTSYFEQLRLELFIKPFTNYLKSIGINERIDKFQNYDYNIHRFSSMTMEQANEPIQEFGIIEHLVKRFSSNIQIAYALNLCNPEDDTKTREKAKAIIDMYFERYQLRLALINDLDIDQISFNQIRAFIISHNLGILEYKNYLNFVKIK